MAVVNPDEQNPTIAQPLAEQPQQGAEPVAAGGAGVTGATDSQAGGSTPGKNTPAQPSAQLSAYLAANQPQASQFAGQIAGQVGQQVQGAGSAIQPAVSTYTGNLSNVTGNQELDQAVAQSPSGLTDEQRAAYQTELSAAGNSPNVADTFETTGAYRDLAGNIQQAVEQANLWGAGNNPAALTTAVRPFEAPTATRGDATLDALLLSQSPGAYKQIQKAIAPAAGLQDQLASGTTSANDALHTAIANNTAATAGANQAAQSYSTSLTQYLQNQQAQAQASQDAQIAQNNAILAAANSGGMTSEYAQALGIPAAQAQAWADAYNGITPGIHTANQDAAAFKNSLGSFVNSYNSSPLPGSITGFNLFEYLHPRGPAPTITQGNVASAKNYADVAALESMMGAGSPLTLPISSATAGDAGKGLTGAPAVSFDKAGAGSGLEGLKGGAGTELKNLKNWIAFVNANHGQLNGAAAAGAGKYESDIANLNNLIATLVGGS